MRLFKVPRIAPRFPESDARVRRNLLYLRLAAIAYVIAVGAGLTVFVLMNLLPHLR